MSRFVTTTAYVYRETMYTYYVYGLSFVCKNDGYRKE